MLTALAGAPGPHARIGAAIQLRRCNLIASPRLSGMIEAVPRHETESTKPTVLVVEDEFMIRAMIVDYLQECGFKVIPANDAGQAIAILQESQIAIDVVFSDIQMPGPVNGFGLARWIRENRPSVRVILGSGDHTKCDLAKDLCEDGPLMRKPYDLKVIVARVRSVLKDLNF